MIEDREAERAEALEALRRAWERLERIPLGHATYVDRAVALEALERFRLQRAEPPAAAHG